MFQFDNRFTKSLPADPETRNVCRQVPQACYSRVLPTTVSGPKLVSYSSNIAERLGLTVANCESKLFTDVFSGNLVFPEMDPFAMCYGGHQFGNWAGQLGDGRAINLGEVIGTDGGHWTLQLKGAGKTPYSRSADGLAVLRSSVREFLCSEAMHHLGVPTTRALSLVLTGEMVVRDMFYDGNPRKEPGAIVCRVAPSFVRFGSFEIFASRDDIENLRRLADFTIRSNFTHLGEPCPEVYAAWFEEVCRKTAEMVVHWMRVGFVHGVMNTDNMSILGLTIDYGPYGWLENYDPDWTPNTTDAHGRRYRFGQQPQIALWNLVRLANAIYPIIENKEWLERGLEAYSTDFANGWNAMMAKKMGFGAFVEATDEKLFEDLQTNLQLIETDMAIFFRKLSGFAEQFGGQPNFVQASDDEAFIAHFTEAFYEPQLLSMPVRKQWCDWLRSYLARLATERITSTDRQRLMEGVNPKYVLRNYLAQLAIDAAEQGDFSKIQELLDVLQTPYADQLGKAHLAEKRPDWARHRAGCSMLSCSS